MHRMYQDLIIYSYKNYKDLQNEYQKRFNAPTTFKTGLHITPFSQKTNVKLTESNYELFSQTIPEHLELMEEIFLLSKRIEKQSGDLPHAAIEYLEISQLINEIKSTNDIEGVKSTKKEIQEAVDARNTHKNVRFKNTVRSYFTILDNEKPFIDDLGDFRDIYDKVVKDEIADEDLPDGKYFRKSGVTIYDERNNKVAHRGVSSEEAIHTALQSLLRFMNRSEISLFYKAIITHYYFEYVHPFYDGNGRMGRFMLSSYLAHKLDPFSALSISESIYNNRNKYDKLFIDASNKNNFGDMTLFIFEMLKIIVKGQKKILNEIELAVLKMEKILNFITEVDLTNDQKIVLSELLQHYLFAVYDSTIENQELDQIIGKQLSRRRIDIALKELEELNYVKQVKGKPITYIVLGDNLSYFE